MSVNGTETIAESKGPQPPPANGRATRVAADSKATPARGMTTRRRRDRQDSEKSAEKNASSLPAEAVTETSRRSGASVLPKRKPSSMRFVNR